MKRLLCVVVAVCALGFVAASFKISQVQAIVADGLENLKLEALPPSKKVMGAPSEFKVTDETIKYLTKLKKDGSKIVVDAQGTIEVKK